MCKTLDINHELISYGIPDCSRHQEECGLFFQTVKSASSTQNNQLFQILVTPVVVSLLNDEAAFCFCVLEFEVYVVNIMTGM